MLFNGVLARPKQLAVMEEAVESYCRTHAIVNEGDRERIARLVVLVFKSGAQTVAELTAELERLDASQSSASNSQANSVANIR